MFEVKQEHEKCIGCQMCTQVCPSNWEMGDDGKAKPKKTKDDADCNLQAEAGCPAKCIHVKKI